jgi:VCBS repeat-containing protein
VQESYVSVRNVLQAQGAPGASTLPSSSPLSGSLYMAQAEAQALGLTSAVSTVYVGFSSALPFSYTPNATPASNQYYFVGVVEHEISEDMGRVSLLNEQPYDYSPIDLFRYSSSGVRTLSTGGNGATAYFSINNGATNLGTWNNQTSNGDLADWYPQGPASGGNDAFNDYSNPGVVNALSANDITLMQALGWSTQTNGIVVSANIAEALQGGSPVAPLMGAPVITDSGKTNLVSATVTITNGSGNAVAGDELFINGQQSGTVDGGLVAVSWNDSTKVLTLTGNVSIATYETLLSEVTCQDTGTDNSNGSHPERTVTWSVNDGTNSYNTTSEVAIDRLPVANDYVVSDAVGTNISATAATGVLSNDTDLDGDKLTVTVVSDAAHGAGTVGTALAGVYGHLTLNADGSYTYTVDNTSAINSAPTGSHLQDPFTYAISDGNGGTASATLTITLDRAPVVTAANVDLSAGQAAVAASSLFTATDPDGNAITTYGFVDTGPGHFVLNGVAQANDQEIDVTAAQLSQLTYQTVTGTADTLQVRAYDGTVWSNWTSFTVTAPPLVIQTDGWTSLTEVGNNYFLYDGGSGPELKYAGAPVVAGEFGDWTPIGAVQTASGYDVAWEIPGANEYTVWSTDSSGNYLSNVVGVVSGTSTALESLAPIFDQDLNGAGVTSVPTVIQTDGSTSLTGVWYNYFLDNSSGSGPELKYAGAAVVAGEFGVWTPIGAVQTASGYDVAWEIPGANEYTVWSTDSSGNYLSNVVGVVSGTSTALESLEPVFNQDLNGDGVIGLYAAPGTTLQIDVPMAGTSGSATIGTGATLELAAADSASVTFNGSTGTLRLDHSSTFSGEIFNFTGNGSLSGSDQIDLRDINYNSVQDSYANGVLTVTDGIDTAKLDFNGSYTLENFKFASDGRGGTIVYDPPAPTSHAWEPNGGNDTFVFRPNFGNETPNIHPPGPHAIQLDHTTFAHDLAELAVAHDGHAVIADVTNDTIALTHVAVPQHHPSDFLI